MQMMYSVFFFSEAFPLAYVYVYRKALNTAIC